MNNSTNKSVCLLSEGKIRSKLHYGLYARDWWSPRPSNSKDNVLVSVPYRLYMHISVILNQRQFYLRVVQGDENRLQPEFVCVSGSETSKVCSTPSQAINSIYHIIFGKKTKTAYSGPSILGFNNKKIVDKLLTGIAFMPIFLNIGNYVVVVSEIGDKKFTSSILTKKSQRTLALQKINNNIYTLDFYKGDQLLWHFEDQSANSVWSQVGITMNFDGETLYRFNHPVVQNAIQINLANSNPSITCTSHEWNDSCKMEAIFEQQIKKHLNLEDSEDSEDSEDLDDLENFGSIFWSSFQNALMSNKRGPNGKTRILSIIADRFKYTQLQKKLQISSHVVELARKHSRLYGPGAPQIQGPKKSVQKMDEIKEMQFLAFFQDKNNVAQSSYKTDTKTGVPILYMQDQKEALWTKFNEAYPNGMRRTSFMTRLANCSHIRYREDLVRFSPAMIANLCNKEIFRLEPKISSHTKPQSKWKMTLLKPQEQNTYMVMEPVDFPWNKGWALHKNVAYGNRGGGKRMTNTVKKMLEQMFLLGNVHAKDRMTAKEMYDRLKEFADNGELEQDEILKVSTIQG
ncbi:11829_t:CDS:2 [Scutellospora calospora]|uniref:11829_t:CDS:1 n=1 Tax=Scutellospora calospora TaxID=85575 RepID=A0ACA9KGB4_9GLOM|nr:11829_t:CDS:2 [Scutellospora calospora]